MAPPSNPALAVLTVTLVPELSSVLISVLVIFDELPMAVHVPVPMGKLPLTLLPAIISMS